MNVLAPAQITPAIRKWKPYTAYKNSGSDLLDEIPSHWDTALLKREFSVRLGKMLQSAPTTATDTLEPYLRAANIFWEGVETTDVREMWFSPEEKNQYALEQGDLLVSEGGDAGRSALWREEVNPCYIQNAINRVRSKGVHSTHFLYYWMYALKHSGYIDMLCSKATISHFTAEKVEVIPVVLPPPKEEELIVAFLDRETAKIDAPAKKKERLIELLQEKRTALLTHAVTKGLDSNVSMKDSGIEWLDKLPAHWDVKRLKYIAQLRSGEAITSSQIEETGDYPVYGGNGLRGYTSSFTHEGEFPLIGRQGALCGCITYAQGRFWASEHAVVAAPRAAHVAKWLAELLRSMNLNQYSQSAAQPGLAVETVMGILVPVAPVEEQHAIAAFIDLETAEIDALVAKVREGIEKLKEYRTALISAAVTGKIDVRAEFPGNGHANASADVT